MALSIKADAEDLPSIFQILGLGGQPPPVDPSLAGAPGADDGQDATPPPQQKSVPTKLGRLQQIISASQGSADSPAMTDQHSSPSVPAPDTAGGPPFDVNAQTQRPSFLRHVAADDAGDASGGLPMGPEPTNVPPPPLGVDGRAGLPADLTQADGGRPQLQKTWAQEHPTLAKILKIGMGAGMGAGAGAGSMTFGEGFQKAQELPLDVAGKKLGLQMQAAQISNLPWQRAALIADLRHKGAQTDAESAKADKDRAEAGAVPAKQALDEAKAAAEKYKEVGGVMYDVSGKTPTPVQGVGTFVPLDAQSAAISGVPVGTKVPLETATKVKALADAGVKSVQAGGRSLLVDSSGKKIADLGAATPVVVNNLSNPMAGAKGDATATGDEVLKGLTPAQATNIKKVSNYEVDPNSLMSARSPGKFAFMAKVSQYDPTYDETQYATRAALRKNFTSGDYSKQINSFTQATHHLGMLDTAIDALDNHNWQLLNTIGNAYHVQMGADAQTNFESIKNAVAGELSKVFKGGIASDPEIAAQNKTLNVNQSPKQLHGAVQTYIGLMRGKLASLDDTYQRGMGKPADFKIISPDTENIFNRLGPSGGGETKPASSTGGFDWNAHPKVQ